MSADGLTAGTWTELVAAGATALAVLVAVVVPRTDRRKAREAEIERDAELEASLVLVDLDKVRRTPLRGERLAAARLRVLVKNYAPGPLRSVVFHVEWQDGEPIATADDSKNYEFNGNICEVRLPHLEPSPGHWVEFAAAGADAQAELIRVTWVDRWGNQCAGAPGAPSKVITWGERARHRSRWRRLRRVISRRRSD